MASGVPKLDMSMTDSRWDCGRCAHRHRPGSSCAKPGRWLVSGALVKPPRHLEVVDAARD